MDQNNKPAITIIGAGLAGCFLAIVLAKKGFKVDIYERSSKDDAVNLSSGKSFNLTFYGYGAQALKEAGVWEAVKPIVIPLKGTKTWVAYEHSSEPIFSRYDDVMPCYAVQRIDLLQVLMEQAELSGSVTFNFNAALVSVNRQERSIVVQDMESKKISTVACDAVLGADGVNSQVRMFLQQGQEASHSQEYALWSYKQITFPQDLAAKLKLQESVMYAWTGKHAVLVAFPNYDRSLTAMLMLPTGKGRGFGSLRTPSAIQGLVAKSFPRLLPALPAMTDAILHNPEGRLSTVHTSPWYYKDFMAIFGDAAHGFLPFYGQGISAAFGDCLELARQLDGRSRQDWGEAFSRYQQARKKHMDTVANLSKETFFLYMRERKADYKAVYAKLESILHGMFPKLFRAELFYFIATDQARAADHLHKDRRQKKLGWLLGIPVLVGLITAAVAVWENGVSLYRAAAARLAGPKVNLEIPKVPKDSSQTAKQ